MSQPQVVDQDQVLNNPNDSSGNRIQKSHTAPHVSPGLLGDQFTSFDLAKAPLVPSGLPSEIWTIVQSTPANFLPQYFLETSRDLLENPNLTVSHLSRAELSYQSFTDATFNPEARASEDLAGIVKHLRGRVSTATYPGGRRWV